MQHPDPLPPSPTGTDRRPLTSRSIPVFRGITHLLVRLNVRPNAISIASIAFGVLAGVALFFTNTEGVSAGAVRGLVFAAAVCIQLRLICNMLDGMVAIEGKTSSAVGELYNEVPDRISDSATIIGAGYALGGWVVGGYIAALLAVLTAYIRAMGKAAGAGSEFCGPMAKPHRMALLTVVCLLLTVAPSSLVPHALIGGADRGLFALAVAIIAAGSAVTCIRRLLRISRTLRGHRSTKPAP